MEGGVLLLRGPCISGFCPAVSEDNCSHSEPDLLQDPHLPALNLCISSLQTGRHDVMPDRSMFPYNRLIIYG